MRAGVERGADVGRLADEHDGGGEKVGVALHAPERAGEAMVEQQDVGRITAQRGDGRLLAGRLGDGAVGEHRAQRAAPGLVPVCDEHPCHGG
jgi:hypothetical protein